MKNKIRIAAAVVCLAVVVFGIISVVKDKKELTLATNEYDNIRSTYADLQAHGSAGDSENDGYPDLAVDIEGLEKTNPDITAWIYMPCLEISYPVVKEKEIDEYLNKTFEGKESYAGSLFEDVLSDENFCGMHDMIFGHNMKDGSMFGKLKEVYSSKKADILKENPYVYIYTRDTVYRYEAFAYEITTAGSDAYSEVNDNDEYDRFIDYVLSNNQWGSGKEKTFENRPSILSLSTCSGVTGGKKRFVIHTFKESQKEVR